MRRPGLIRALLLPLALVAGLPAVLPSQQRLVFRIPITGTIENGLAPYVARSLREAADSGAAAAYLDIDTPGGRVDAAQRIADAVRGAPFPVYAFVDPRAFSAGALVALASDGIYMRPGAVLGAATPVDGEGTKAPEKYVSAMRAEFRALAEEQGLDPRIAEAMVDESVGVPGLVEPGRLLTLSTAEALKVGYAKAQVESEAELLERVGLAGARVVTLEVNWAESLVRFLTNPVVAPLLLSLGVLGILAEVKAGASGAGLLVGLVALGLFFGANLLVGLAGWEEVLLLGLGLLALAVEIFVLPGFGVAGVLGLCAIGASLVMAMLGSLPSTGDIVQALAVLGASLLITTAVVFAWLRHLPSSNRLSGLLLRGGIGSGEGYVSAAARADLVGREGIAVTDLRPAGTAAVGDERVDVVTEGEYIPSGSRVRVVRSEGYRHVVRPA